MTTSRTIHTSKPTPEKSAKNESPLTADEQHLNILADTCLEMYDCNELASTKRVLRQLQASYPDVPSEQLLVAIQRALTWQRQGGHGVNTVH